MLDDDGTLMGDFPMPDAYWRLSDATGIPIVVRVTAASIPALPRVAFAHEFQRESDIYGQRYLDLWDLTRHDAYRPDATPRWHTFQRLSAAFPQTFTTVIGRDGPAVVWLALPLARLADAIADALTAAHHAQRP